MPANLYDLEGEYHAAQRDIRDVLDRARSAHERLKSYPVTDRDIEAHRHAARIAEDLLFAYENERTDLANIDAEILRLQELARLSRRRLDRGRVLFSPAGQVAVCICGVLAALLLSSFCLFKVPIAIWAILFTLFAIGVVLVTLVVFSMKRQSHSARQERLSTDLGSIEDEISSIKPTRTTIASKVDDARDKCTEADKRVQELEDRIEPWLRHERAVEKYEKVRRYFEVIRTEYEEAQTERKLRLLRRGWRYLKADEFEAFVREVFETLGFQTSTIGKAGDQGVDIIATRNGVRWAIQCKGYAGSLGNKPIQEVYTGACFHGCQRWIVITTSTFTSGGREAATRTGCVIIEGRDIPQLIEGNIRLS